MSFLRLYCIRHGQTENYQAYAFNGWTDVQLTEEGRRQLDQAVAALKGVPFTAVYSSDLSRAAYGGLALARQLNLSLQASAAFREIHFGEVEGLPWETIQERYPDLAGGIIHPKAEVTFPGGESTAGFQERIRAALNDLIAKNPAGQVALVSHAGVGRAVLADLLNLGNAAMWALEQDHASLNVLDVLPGRAARVKAVNVYLGPEGYRAPGPGYDRLFS
jgi:broad specificity phosphatase PhoE